MAIKITLRCILFCTQLVLFTHLNAQSFQLTVLPITSPQFGSKDFCSANLLVSGSLNKFGVKLKAEVKSVSGEVLVTAYSRPVQVDNGMNILLPQHLNFDELTYYATAMKQSDDVIRSFPTGNYIYCISILDAVTGEVKANNCMDIDVTVMANPLLIYPGNKDFIHEKNPLLTWFFPGLNSGLNEVNYILTLVELYEEQEAMDGILRNKPLVFERGLAQTSFQYPYQAKALEYGKRYAWQVEALGNNNRSFGLTEVWEFSLRADSIEELSIPINQSYIDIKNSGSYQAYFAKGVLKVKHSERVFPSDIAYKIYDSETLKTVHTGNLKVLAKENWYEIDLERELKFKHKHKYLFELQSNNNIYKVYFIYLDPVKLK